MFEPTDVRNASAGSPADPWQEARRDSVARRRLTAGLAVAAGLVLGACSIPFGNGTGTSGAGQSAAETRRESNRRYLEEQRLMEQQRQFDRVGPSDR